MRLPGSPLTQKEIDTVVQEANSPQTTSRRELVRRVLDDPSSIWAYQGPLDQLRNGVTWISWNVEGKSTASRGPGVTGDVEFPGFSGHPVSGTCERLQTALG